MDTAYTRTVPAEISAGTETVLWESFCIFRDLWGKMKPGGKAMKEDEKKLPNWEMVDPKPPVIQSGHLENRKQH